MEKIKNIIVCPKDIKVTMFYFRKGKVVKKIIVEDKNGNKYFIYDNMVNKFIKYVPGIKYRELISITDWKKRNEIINNSIKHLDKSLVFSVKEENNKVIRISTKDFTPLPHRYVINAMRTILADKIKSEYIDTTYGMFAYWELKNEIIKDIHPIIWVYNRNDVVHSLRIGYGFISSYGVAISGRDCKKLVHRGSFDRLNTEMVKHISYLMKKIDNLTEIINNAIKTKISIDDIDEIVDITYKKLPKWIYKNISNNIYSLSNPTIWDISTIFQIYSRHDDATMQQKLKLMDIAMKIVMLAIGYSEQKS